MHRKNLSIGISFCAIIFAILTWWEIQRAILVSGVSNWALPILLFSLLYIFLSLAVILIDKNFILRFILLFVFLMNMLFVFNFWHLIFIFLGFLVAYLGIRTIRKDLKLNVRIDIWKSLQTGRSLMVVGFAILIASQYYFTIQKNEGQKIIPNFETGKLTGQLSSKILAAVNPDFKALEKEGITVDEFILQTQQNQSQDTSSASIDAESDKIIDEQFGANISQVERDQLKKQARERVALAQSELSAGNKQLILTEGRRQLALLAGKDLVGNEKMTDVLSGFVDKKINDYFSPKVGNPDATKLLPLVMSGVLFFTIWPLGSFLAIIWILLANLIFMALVRFHFIGVRKVLVEMEVIE